jgi:hypothetical protein
MYFDCVVDENLDPVYNGTPKETKAWLESQEVSLTITWQVCVGETLDMVSIPRYLGME